MFYAINFLTTPIAYVGRQVLVAPLTQSFIYRKSSLLVFFRVLAVEWPPTSALLTGSSEFGNTEMKNVITRLTEMLYSQCYHF
jgi:hypothetical protein